MGEPQTAAITVLADGKHIRLVRSGRWEFVERKGITGIVGIVAVTDDAKLILLEQYRRPVDNRVIEIPAGLVGDEVGQENESLLSAARRELEEETGYYAEHLSPLGSGAVSAGLSNEIVSLWFASGVMKRAAGGGVGGESITVHAVPLSDVTRRLAEWTAEGKLIDLKVYAALHFVAVQAKPTA